MILRFIFTALLMIYAFAAHAQQADGSYTSVDAPRSEASADYEGKVSVSRTQTRATYAKDVQNATPSDIEPVYQEQASFSGFQGSALGVALVIISLIVLIFLWLKFGSAGLLDRKPSDIKKRPASPDGWEAADQPNSAGDFLEQIAAMADRREALICLLRHCLLTAGQSSDTHFARADTEREAFRRLPQSLAERQRLIDILKAAELVHYGGRPVTDKLFELCLAQARTFLNTLRGRHA